MKILQINAVYGTGSTGRIVAELSDGFKQTGDETFVAYQTSRKAVENGFSMGNNFLDKAEALSARVFGLQAYGRTIETKRLLRWMGKIQPDIVHLHNLHSNYINFSLLLRYLAEKDIPTVITLHDCWPFTGKCTHYTAVRCDKWKSGCGGCPQLKKDIPSWFFDRTAKMWSDKKQLFSELPRLAVVGVSDWITDEARKSFLGNAKIIERIYNWIDLEIFYPRKKDVRAQYHISQDKFTLLCIGAGWKDGTTKFDDLLLLADKLPSNMQIVLVGNAETDKRLPKNIISIGYIHDVDMLAEVYSSVDVYVHLSREDTFGKVIAEALACGTPAVVYNSTACPELIGDGCGYIVQTGNLDEMCRCVTEIERNGKKTYSPACVAWVETHFKKEELLRQTRELYLKLLDE